MKRSAWALAVLSAILSLAATSNAQTTKGAVIFEDHCATCHGNPSAATASPEILSLWKMTPEAIYAALGGGPHTSLKGLTDNDLREVAFYLGRRKVDIGKITDAKLMPNPCPGNSPIGNLSAKPLWNGWGNDISNARFQPAKGAGLTAEQVPNLKLKWAFGFPGADEVYGHTIP
jgi:polyvinyl alcohol dehydrogenase (cytochrome)